ncbi:MAG: hypothetical protein OES79_09770 [Planctomycetota bacterium]|nr:hypothetical protein [Planctomycetota bacterium]
MAFRIGDCIVRGEINNTRRNSVSGWLDFGGDEGVRIELTGNLDGDLAGKHVHFQVPPPAADRDDATEQYLDELEFRQIGVVGRMTLRMVRVPRGSVEEFLVRSKLGEPPPIDEKPCLYLEWFSQNGRVVAEIVDPEIQCGTSPDESDEGKDAADTDGDSVAAEPLPDADNVGGPEIVGFAANEHGYIEEIPFGDELQQGAEREDDDTYQLFDPDLERQLGESNREHDDPPYSDDEPSGRRSWDEVIPGIDDQTKRMYEEWDEVVYGEKDEPLATLFDPPLSLKQPDQLASEAEAEEALAVLLARLALHGVTLDMCEHFSALDAYRYMLEDILPEAQIHPRLPDTGFIQHYSTWENCPVCEAEFEADWERRNKDDQADSPPA